MSGNGTSRVFYVSGASTTSISGLTITDGYAVNSTGAGITASNVTSLTLDHVTISNCVNVATIGYPHGGGVGMDGGTLIITNSTISGNSADWAGGGIAIYNDSSSILTNVTFNNNHATLGATGIYGGGAMYLQSNPGFSSTLTNVTISNNTSVGDGGGVYVQNHQLSLIQSAVSSNSSVGDGGGIYIENSITNIEKSTFNGNSTTGNSLSDGGAIFNVGVATISTLTIKNSTFSDNTVTGHGGAIFNGAGGGSIAVATTTITNSTIVENHASNSFTGGGIFAGTASSIETSQITLSNSILYGNTISSGTNGENCATSNPGSSIVTDDHNLFEDLVNDCVAEGTDLLIATSGLSAIVNPLASNGGPTQTRSLPAASVAVNAGNNSSCEATDQRGASRPQGPSCDIGAYEYVAPMTLISTAAQDGWILESSETSGKGGMMNSTATTLFVGDDAANKQYRAILSFNTSALPDNAIITSVMLRFKHAGKMGTLPFATHGNLLAEIRKGPFGGNPSLQLNDFKAARNGVLTIPSTTLNKWYSNSFSPANFQYVSLNNVTQIRLRFSIDDNNDSGADFLKIYSGNAGAANRPQLIVEYIIP